MPANPDALVRSTNHYLKVVLETDGESIRMRDSYPVQEPVALPTRVIGTWILQTETERGLVWLETIPDPMEIRSAANPIERGHHVHRAARATIYAKVPLVDGRLPPATTVSVFRATAVLPERVDDVVRRLEEVSAGLQLVGRVDISDARPPSRF